MHEAVGRERAAPESSVADTRGGADGELAVLDAALDAVAETHQPGEAEVDPGLERIVAAGLRECLAVESHGVLRARLDAGQMGQDGRALVARRSRGARLFEQRRCPVVVPGAVVHVGCHEQAPTGVIRTRWRA